MTKYVLLFFIVIPLYTFTQVSIDDTTFVHPNSISKKDTVIIYKYTDDNLAYTYEQILEKTNKQLSLWWNPYGVFVGSLGVLFAVLAIIAAFVIFRQSNEYKKLIKDSLDEHKIALDKLIAEKENQFEFYNGILDNTIQEYRDIVSQINKNDKNLITDFITKLEELKVFVNPQIQVHKHFGWKYKDIFVNYPVSKSTTINIKISLSVPKQSFVIYFRVVADDNKKYWIGFAGNSGEDKSDKFKNEYTQHRTYTEKEINISENIYNVFIEGFSNFSIQPILIDCVRLRGSKTDIREITYIYQINY